MKKLVTIFLSAFLLLSFLSSCDTQQIIPALEDSKSSHTVQKHEAIEKPSEGLSAETFSFDELENTQHFTKNSLEHIFYGEINRQGNAVGYHSESIQNTPGTVVQGTRSQPNDDGVYTGQVEVDGVKKAGNGGYSSFFPEDWQPQQVVDAINQAYETRQLDRGNTFLGETEDGMIIQMYLTDQNKIISAFPIY